MSRAGLEFSALSFQGSGLRVQVGEPGTQDGGIEGSRREGRRDQGAEGSRAEGAERPRGRGISGFTARAGRAALRRARAVLC